MRMHNVAIHKRSTKGHYVQERRSTLSVYLSSLVYVQGGATRSIKGGGGEGLKCKCGEGVKAAQGKSRLTRGKYTRT